MDGYRGRTYIFIILTTGKLGLNQMKKGHVALATIITTALCTISMGVLWNTESGVTVTGIDYPYLSNQTAICNPIVLPQS